MKQIRFLLVLGTLSVLLTALLGCGSDDKPTGSDNAAPVISSITASPSSFQQGELCTVTVVASDPDGDNLQYSWDHHNAESQLEWVSAGGNTAVLTTCGCLIVDDLYAWVLATVRDGRGGEAIDSVEIVVLLPEE